MTSNIISIISRQPIIQQPIQPLFGKGDSFTTEDGVRVHVMAERDALTGREILLCAHGTKIWMPQGRFARKS